MRELTACGAGGRSRPATANHTPAGHLSVPPTGRESLRTSSSRSGYSPEEEVGTLRMYMLYPTVPVPLVQSLLFSPVSG